MAVKVTTHEGEELTYESATKFDVAKEGHLYVHTPSKTVAIFAPERWVKVDSEDPKIS